MGNGRNTVDMSDLVDGAEQEVQTPAERAFSSIGAGQGIGQARLRNAALPGLAKPSNKLPDGEDPAGWFIVGGRYVNCDGLTPEQLAEQDPEFHRRRAEQAHAEADAATNQNERYARIIEAMQLEARAKDAELEELRSKAAAQGGEAPPDGGQGQGQGAGSGAADDDPDKGGQAPQPPAGKATK